jgi:ankyrin repeat protein
MEAHRCSHLALVKCLVNELGADVNKAGRDGSTPLHTAAFWNNVDMLRCLGTSGADVSQASITGGTPLHIAADNGNVAAVRCLVKDLGANVDQANHEGVTPVFGAAENGHLDVLRYLVNKLGADINKGTHSSATPLMAASRYKHDEVVRWLLKNGAISQTRLNNSFTAADISKHSNAPAEQTAYLEARTLCAKSGCDGAGLKKCASCLEVFLWSKDCKADCKLHVKMKTGR